MWFTVFRQSPKTYRSCRWSFLIWPTSVFYLATPIGLKFLENSPHVSVHLCNLLFILLLVPLFWLFHILKTSFLSPHHGNSRMFCWSTLLSNFPKIQFLKQTCADTQNPVLHLFVHIFTFSIDCELLGERSHVYFSVVMEHSWNIDVMSINRKYCQFWESIFIVCYLTEWR